MPGFMTQEQLQEASRLGFDDFNNLPQEQQDAVNAWLKDPKAQLAAQHSSQEYAGTNYGDRMRELGRQGGGAFATVDHAGIDEARTRMAQSYGQQQQALAAMRQQAEGGGPSAANAQTQMQSDAVMRNMSGASGGNLRGALTSTAMGDVTAQGGAARGQEVGAAQQGFAGGAAQMRGQSLQDYGQGLQNAYGASQLNLSQQDQDMRRRLAYEKLAMGGYKMDINGRNAMANAAQKVQFNRQAINDAYTGAGISAAGAGAAQAQSAYGSGGNADRGGKSWSDWEGPKY